MFLQNLRVDTFIEIQHDGNKLKLIYAKFSQNLAKILAKIYVVFQNMIFGGKFVSTIFSHYLHCHAKFLKKQFSNKDLQGIPPKLTQLP